MIGGLADIAGATSDGFTVRVAGAEVTTTEGELLSVTCSSKDHVPTVVRVPVEIDTGELHDEELPQLL